MEEVYRLDTRDRPGLLFAMMHALATEGGRMSLEGSLSQTEVMRLDGVTQDETGALKRATLQPKLDFVVLPLIPATIDAIERAIRSKIAFGGYRGIIHAQIETNGRLAFAAYDNFHKDCVYAGTRVSSEFLDRLIETKVLRSYQRVQQPSVAFRI
jgi:hypothetical protein